MTSPNSVRRMALAAVSSLLAACGTPQPRPAPDVADIATVFLAEPMRQAAVEMRWQVGAAEQSEAVSCLASVDATKIGEQLAPTLFYDLTPVELHEADAFLASPSGRAFRKQQRLQSSTRTMTTRAIDDLRIFSETPAGEKLVGPRAVTRYMPAFDAHLAQVAQWCETKPQLVEVSMSPQVKRPPGYPEFRCDMPKVSYPRTAWRQGDAGRVVVRLWVNEFGNVYLTALNASSGTPALDTEARRAVKAMQCTPYELDGKAIPVHALQPIEFRLQWQRRLSPIAR